MQMRPIENDQKLNILPKESHLSYLCRSSTYIWAEVPKMSTSINDGYDLPICNLKQFQNVWSVY